MTVTAITPQKRRPYRLSVFIDGEFAFGIHSDDAAFYKLAEGMEISRERLDYLLEQVVFSVARDTALRFLSGRARTYKETVNRLKEDEYTEDVIERVMLLLAEEYRYIDDAKYARDYAESRLKNGGYGLRRVKQELIMKGVSRELISEALEYAQEDNSEAGVALEWLKRKRPDTGDPVKKKRCADALFRRGFSYSTVKEAFAAYEEYCDE